MAALYKLKVYFLKVIVSLHKMLGVFSSQSAVWVYRYTGLVSSQFGIGL